MYPNCIRKRKLYPLHLNPVWNKNYQNLIIKRIDAKKKFKETKDGKYQAIQEAFKLAMNGGSYGKTGESTSWQYCQFTNKSITIGCQIDLLMLIEQLECAGITVLSANTDGLVCLFDKLQEATYYKVCKDWEIQVGNHELGQLEYQDYSKLIQLSVNSYIAITPEGKIKQKNDFVTEHPLYKNKSFRIIPIALVNYYKNNIPVKDTILNHRNIFDFCAGIKAKGDFYFEVANPLSEETQKLQKVNRYIISTNGEILLKKHPDGRQSFVDAHPAKNKMWKSTILNKIDSTDAHDYPIDYDFYIYQTNLIIKSIPVIEKPKVTQTKLF